MLRDHRYTRGTMDSAKSNPRFNTNKAPLQHV